ESNKLKEESNKLKEESNKLKEESDKIKEEANRIKEESEEKLNKIKKESAQKIDEAIIETNIRYVLRGKISVEEAVLDCGLTLEEFLKKKEEYKTKNNC
ncbi:MAG: hypothetical protein ACI4WM_09900, partial [Erysipelotrichaceae bacterium]